MLLLQPRRTKFFRLRHMASLYAGKQIRKGYRTSTKPSKTRLGMFIVTVYKVK